MISKKIEVNGPLENLTKIRKFAERLDYNGPFEDFKVNKYNENTFFFRKEMIQSFIFRSKSIGFMHGCIQIDPENNNVTVKGFLNYFQILLIAFFLITFASDLKYSSDPSLKESVFFALFVFLIMLIIFLIFYKLEYKKYKEIINEITRLANAKA